VVKAAKFRPADGPSAEEFMIVWIPDVYSAQNSHNHEGLIVDRSQAADRQVGAEKADAMALRSELGGFIAGLPAE
jgi:hypothetical protein